jgi:xanthine dehydrogenase YagS FAD-binding subunit
MITDFAYVSANSLKDAVKQLSSPGARVHAGGTDLLSCLRDEIFVADKIVSLTRLDSLRGIGETPDGGVRIGALTTIAEVALHPLVKDRYTALSQAASAVGSPQLRNQGTIGGNICQKPRCWYYRGEFHCLRKGGDLCYAASGQNQFHAIMGSDNLCYIVHPSDTAPALIALAAKVRVVGPSESKLVPLEKFFVSPGVSLQTETVLKKDEIVTEILLPKVAAGTWSSYRKVRARRSWDFALAGVALVILLKEGTVADARVVLSGAAPVPWRSREAEEKLRGRKIDEQVAASAGAAAMQKADPLEHNQYKVPLFQSLLEEQILQTSRS